MADERKAGALILSNLGMFNESAVIFENIVQLAILKAIDYTVETFAKENELDGEFNLAGDNEECWLSPVTWNISDPQEDAFYKASFDIKRINGDKDYLVALFCKQGSEGGEVGFVFDIDPKQFGGRATWNSYIKNINQDIVSKLEKAGFKHQGKGKFFLPVHLDVIEIKAAWEEYGDENTEDFAGDCLAPLQSALQTIQANCGLFDEIMYNVLR